MIKQALIYLHKVAVKLDHYVHLLRIIAVLEVLGYFHEADPIVFLNRSVRGAGVVPANADRRLEVFMEEGF